MSGGGLYMWVKMFVSVPHPHPRAGATAVCWEPLGTSAGNRIHSSSHSCARAQKCVFDRGLGEHFILTDICVLKWVHLLCPQGYLKGEDVRKLSCRWGRASFSLSCSHVCGGIFLIKDGGGWLCPLCVAPLQSRWSWGISEQASKPVIPVLLASASSFCLEFLPMKPQTNHFFHELLLVRVL